MEGYRSCLSSHTTGEDYKEERVTCLGSVPGTCLQAPPVRLPPGRMVACEKKAFEFCSVRLLLPGGYLCEWLLQDAESRLHVLMSENTDNCRKEGSRKSEVMVGSKPTQGTHSMQ